MNDSNFIIKGTCLIKYIGNERDVIVPDGITRISGNCFSMTKIETVTLPETVEDIGHYAFAFCRHLSWINLVNGIRSIGDNAFYGCINLFYINCNSTDTTTLFLPKNLECLGKYAFAGLNVEAIKFNGTKIKTISKHCFSYCYNLHSVYLPNCLAEIESCAFEGNRSLKKLSIPNSVKHIGSRAFYKCLSLVLMIIRICA